MLEQRHHDLILTTQDQDLLRWEIFGPFGRRGKDIGVVISRCGAQVCLRPRDRDVGGDNVADIDGGLLSIIVEGYPGGDECDARQRLAQSQGVDGLVRMRRVRQHAHGQITSS